MERPNIVKSSPELYIFAPGLLAGCKIRELVEDEIVRLRKIHTDDNTSDILTKYLAKNRFEKLRKALLNM